MRDRDTTTPYYYAGSQCSIVSFMLLGDDGVRLTISMHITGESLSAVLPWNEFAELASEAAQICATHTTEG